MLLFEHALVEDLLLLNVGGDQISGDFVLDLGVGHMRLVALTQLPYVLKLVNKELKSLL